MMHEVMMKVEAMQEKLYEFEVIMMIIIMIIEINIIMTIVIIIVNWNQVNKRNNLLFYGVPNDARETPKQLLQKVSILSDQK